LGPGKVVCLRRHEFGDTILLVDVLVLQLGDAVQGTGLGSEERGRCLEVQGSRISWVRINRWNCAKYTWKEAARRALGRARRLNMMALEDGDALQSPTSKFPNWTRWLTNILALTLLRMADRPPFYSVSL
jgi:hypothetical protein